VGGGVSERYFCDSIPLTWLCAVKMAKRNKDGRQNDGVKVDNFMCRTEEQLWRNIYSNKMITHFCELYFRNKRNTRIYLCVIVRNHDNNIAAAATTGT